MNNNLSGLNLRPDVIRSKHKYGIWFGIAMGAAFSIFTWGIDAYQLSRINGFMPWLRFSTGILLCVTTGGFTGWLSARLEKPLWSFFLWAATASLFAWLTVSIPIQIAPWLMNLFQPDLQGLLHLEYYTEFSTRVGVAYAWIAIFTSLGGLLQIPLSEPAVFSSSMFGRIAPLVVCFILMGICGTNADGLINESFRSATEALNSTIQFSLDNEGKTIDKAVARQNHLGALREIPGLVTQDRKLVVSGYDDFLVRVDVLVKFKDAWVACTVIYNQPSVCREVTPIP